MKKEKVYIGDFLTKNLTVEPITKLRRSKKVIIAAICFVAGLLLLCWGIPALRYALSEEYVSRGEQEAAISTLQDVFEEHGVPCSIEAMERKHNNMGAFASEVTLGQPVDTTLHIVQFGSEALLDKGIRSIYHDGTVYFPKYAPTGAHTLDAEAPHWYRHETLLLWIDSEKGTTLELMQTLFGPPLFG